MWKSLVLPIATMALKVLAPNAADVVGKIQTVAEVALPIVAEVAKSNIDNDAKWDKAVADTVSEIARNSSIGGGVMSKENIIESGVQLAYSIFKGQK